MKPRLFLPALFSVFGLLACQGRVSTPPFGTSLAIAYGTLTDVRGAPVPLATVRAYAFRGACDAASSEVNGNTTSDAAGRYRAELRSVSAPESRCIGIWVVRTAATGRDSIFAPGSIVILRSTEESARPDSIQIDVRLP